MKKRRNFPKPPPLEKISTLERILHHGAVASVVLLVAAAVAFYLANGSLIIRGQPLHHWYEAFWHRDFGMYVNGRIISKSLHLLINDGLMAIFFFFVGLEIKRELLVGELATFRKAILPVVAAAGGMICPALVFALITWGDPAAKGWGIPMATDIAFAAGVLGLLAKRIPPGLAVFLIALAIVDDLGSVVVIAVFYTESIATRPLIVGLTMIALSYFLSKLGLRSAFVFFLMACIIWIEFFQSGVHATIAGVLFAFTIPADASYQTPLFIERLKKLSRRFRDAEDNVNPLLVNARQQRIIRAIEAECIFVEAPLQRIERKLHPYCAFLIMPIFAFANAGVHLDVSGVGEVLKQPVTYGVFLGLIVGKQIGIMSACWLAVKVGLTDLPKGVRWIQLYGLSWLAGIGFTMSLFIGSLTFPLGSSIDHATMNATATAMTPLLTGAKIGTLLASVIAAIGGTLIILYSSPKNQAQYH